MSEDLLPKSEKRNLRYDFTAKETHDLSLQLATETKKLASIEQEKASVSSQYGAKIKESTATCNKLANLVADGYEIREIECEVIFHKPQQGKKTIIRKDTNKVTAIEAMTEWEWNLFNQPEDEEKETTTDGRKYGKSGKGKKASNNSAKGKKGSRKKKQEEPEDNSAPLEFATDEITEPAEEVREEEEEDFEESEDNDDNEEE